MQKYRESNRAGDNITNRLMKVLFIIYLAALSWILLFKLGVRFSYMQNRSVNLIPFRESLGLGEIVMNVVIFVPLGVYACVLFKRWTFVNKLLFFFLTSLMFEALQLIVKIGAFDTTDIITNTLGGIIGWGIFEAIEKICNNSIKAHKFISILAAAGTFLMLVLLLLLKMNMLPVRYQ